ncbi:MAG TPA: helix-turn-helix transcriptional regulator [Stellaceae bacterium]|nr:helix-turn-helix transcriptional regulator [Stellaceae bacterium]
MAEAPGTKLRSRDARRSLATFDAIAAEAHSPQSFVHQALDGLAELVGSDLTTLSLCDLERQTRMVVGRRGEALSDADRAAFDRHFPAHPLVRFHSTHPRGATQRITDCVTPRAFVNSPVFADYYRRIGINHVMALPLRIDDATVVSVVFNRRGANFADADRVVADVLRAPLAALYRSITAREEARLSQASLKSLAAAKGWFTAKVSVAGRFLDAPARSFEMLRYFFRDAPTGGGSAPAALQQWLRRRSTHWGMSWLHPGAGAPYVTERGGWRLTIHFIADPLAAERGELMMLRERAAIAPDELSALPLTRRERDVLAILAAGKSNAEIAALLAISPRTVQKHLEHIFEKLGVETRTSATLRALGAAGAR